MAVSLSSPMIRFVSVACFQDISARKLIIVGWLLLAPATGWAAPITLDFEELDDLAPVANQYPGLTFQNATVLTAGISLNEFEFPPASGQRVVADDGGPLSILFTQPVVSFSGFFTYLAPLTLQAYDLADVLVASVTSAFMANLALSGESGSAPNELLGVSVAAGIARITITGDPLGSSFALDDATIVDAAATAIPEPTTLLLVATGCALLARRKWRTR